MRDTRKKKIELIQAQRTTKKTHIKEQWIFFGIVQLKTVFLKGAHIAQQCNGKQQRECDVMQCNVMQWWECGWFYEAWLCSIFIILAARLLYYSRIFQFNVENKHHLLALNFCYQIIYRTSSYKHTDRDLVATKYTAYRHLPSRQPSKQASRRAGRQACELMCREEESIQSRSNRLLAYALSTWLLQLDIISSANDETESLQAGARFLPLSALRTRILDTCANCKRPKKGTEHLNEVIKIKRQVKTKRKWNEIENERKRNAKSVCVCVCMQLSRNSWCCKKLHSHA